MKAQGLGENEKAGSGVADFKGSDGLLCKRSKVKYSFYHLKKEDDVQAKHSKSYDSLIP